MSSFNAKPRDTYLISSSEGATNIKRIYDYLLSNGYAYNCIIGIEGNIYQESGLNPWLWEDNTVNYAKGYGLFQFTPASDYINATGIPNHAPNLTTTAQSPGADPDDAYGQMYCVINDTFGKWVSSCWRSYYPISDFPDLYAERQHVLTTYGNGSSLTQAQFKLINDYTDACFAFLMCYEGPANESGNTIRDKYNARLNYCAQIKTILDSYGGSGDILFLKKIINGQRRFIK